MKVLVIGGGAREHALCRSLSLDPDVTALHCAPGNAGIAEVAELHPVDQLDGGAVAALANELGADLVARFHRPILAELSRRGTPFRGALYAGLILTGDGPVLLECNARFGDPETQVVLARLKTPLAGVLLHSANGTLADQAPLAWRDEAAVTVVVASHNYPDTPRTGDPIEGLAEIAEQDAPHAYVLHAGTKRDGEAIVSAGGRVLSVTATGSDLAQARDRAYAAVGRIRLDGSQHRTDIALKAAGA